MGKLEKEVEIYLVKRVKEKGGLCLKFISPSLAGVPDRIGLLPGGNVRFIELKARGKKLRPLQQAVHSMFNRLGIKVYVLDSKESVDLWISSFD